MILDEAKEYADTINNKEVSKLETKIKSTNEKTKTWCAEAMAKDIGSLKQAAAQLKDIPALWRDIAALEQDMKIT